MSCTCTVDRLQKKHVVLRFVREELLYDTKNYCYIEGDTMQTTDEHQKHQVFDVGESGNVDRVTRMLDLVFSQVEVMCFPFSKREMNDMCSYDDELEESEEYVLRLNVPQTFDGTRAKMLEKSIHELLVYRVVEDWLSITKPGSDVVWKEKADTLRSQILSTLRGGTFTRSLSTF